MFLLPIYTHFLLLIFVIHLHLNTFHSIIFCFVLLHFVLFCSVFLILELCVLSINHPLRCHTSIQENNMLSQQYGCQICQKKSQKYLMEFCMKLFQECSHTMPRYSNNALVFIRLFHVIFISNNSSICYVIDLYFYIILNCYCYLMFYYYYHYFIIV